MVAISRVGDSGIDGSSPGVITSGVAGNNADGIEIAVVGSSYNCSAHGITTIISSPITTIKINGQVVAMVGSMCACGAMIIGGSSNVNV